MLKCTIAHPIIQKPPEPANPICFQPDAHIIVIIIIFIQSDCNAIQRPVDLYLAYCSSSKQSYIMDNWKLLSIMESPNQLHTLCKKEVRKLLYNPTTKTKSALECPMCSLSNCLVSENYASYMTPLLNVYIVRQAQLISN